MSGLWGLIAAGLFKADGLLRSGNVNMLIWNVIGGACIIVWHAICSAILFITLKKLGLLRIPKKLEESGPGWLIMIAFTMEPTHYTYVAKAIIISQSGPISSNF